MVAPNVTPATNGVPATAACAIGQSKPTQLGESGLQILWTINRVSSVRSSLLDEPGTEVPPVFMDEKVGTVPAEWDTLGSDPIPVGVEYRASSIVGSPGAQSFKARVVAYSLANQQGGTDQKDAGAAVRVFNPPVPNVAWPNYPTQAEHDAAKLGGNTAFKLALESSGFFSPIREAKNPSQGERAAYGLDGLPGSKLLVIRPTNSVPYDPNIAGNKNFFVDEVSLKVTDAAAGVTDVHAHVIGEYMSDDLSSWVDDGNARDRSKTATCLDPAKGLDPPTVPDAAKGIAPAFVIPAYFDPGTGKYRIPDLDFTFTNKNGSRTFNASSTDMTQEHFLVNSFTATAIDLHLAP